MKLRGRRGARGRTLAAMVATALALACARTLVYPDLGQLYNRAAQEHELERNPIVVIPGILGSRLRDAESDEIVWGAFVPLRSMGSDLALPMRRGAPLVELQDGIVADEVLDRVRVTWLNLTVEQKAYVHLLGALGAGGYRDQNLGLAGAIDYGSDHFTCFQFAYDWRRDLVESSRALDAFLREKRAYVIGEFRRRYGVDRSDVRFDIVAHSMGGLVLRYYLRYGTAEPPPPGAPPTWAGAELVDRAVLVGTPNAGSVSAFEMLLEGERPSWMLPRYEPAVVGTFPSLYQLLPRPRHARVVDGEHPHAPLDLLDPALWKERGWGLSSPSQQEVLAELLPDVPEDQRAGVAEDHQRKSLMRARAVFEALDRPAAPPPGLSLYLIAGDAEPTPARMAAGTVRDLRMIETGPGDGRVLRSSAILDERVGQEWTPRLRTPIQWTGVTFLFSDHLGMTRDPAFTDNLLFLLLEEPRAPVSP